MSGVPLVFCWDSNPLSFFFYICWFKNPNLSYSLSAVDDNYKGRRRWMDVDPGNNPRLQLQAQKKVCLVDSFICNLKTHLLPNPETLVLPNNFSDVWSLYPVNHIFFSVLFFLLKLLIIWLWATAEVSSVKWESIVMTEQEEDLIRRMYKLVGDR